MPKYRLKDAKLQALLDEISGGDFSKQLNEMIERELSYPLQNPISAIPVAFGDWGADVYGDQSPRYIARFHIKEIESVPSYDPHGWNPWPGVEPPAMTAMRIEADDGTGIKAFWDEGWRRYGSGVFISCPSLKFRPWEDE